MIEKAIFSQDEVSENSGIDEIQIGRVFLPGRKEKNEQVQQRLGVTEEKVNILSISPEVRVPLFLPRSISQC